MTDHAGELQIPSATGTGVMLQVAGVGARSYAYLVDYIIRIFASAAWYLTFSWALRLLRGETLADLMTSVDKGSGWAIAGAVLPAVAIFLFYHPVFELAWDGRTPGKRVAGVRLVDPHGRTPSLTAVLVRNLFRMIDALPTGYVVGLASCVLTAHTQRLGDLAAGTLLVYDAPAVDPADFDDRVMAASTVPTASLAAQLLARWVELDPTRRRTLAKKLLRLEVGPGEPEPEESVLTARLGELLNGPG